MMAVTSRPSPRRSMAAYFHFDRRKIAPSQPFLGGGAEQVGGVEDGRRRDRPRHPRRLKTEPAAPQPADAVRLAEQRARRGSSQCYENIGVDQFEHAFDERHAGRDLARGRTAVARRSPEDRVRNEHLGSVEIDRRQHAVEKTTAGADKRDAASILLSARRLADENDSRGRATIAENQVGGGSAEWALLEGG